MGDDLRFVHWPSTARRDELMIKQLETPWQSRALVLLDIRRSAYENQACFEKAVKGAASMIRHLAESGFDADLWAGGGTTTSIDDYSATMGLLAAVQPSGSVDIRSVAARLSAIGRGGALILVSGVADGDLLDAHRLFSRDYTTSIVMLAAEAASMNIAAFHRLGATTVTVSPQEPWAVAWNRALERTWGRPSAV